MPISGNQTKASIARAQRRKINFKALKRRNSQIIAWVSIPNAPIDYPIVKGRDNQFYLSNNAMRQRSSSGAIFLDSKLRSNFNNQDSIVYGHNMRDGSMFGSLDRYQNRAYRNRHQFIFVYTPKQTRRYRVSNQFVTRSTRLNPDRSKNKTLTLVTCNYTAQFAHYVVRARLVSVKPPGRR
jgi:SrtB family sortase